MSHKSPRFAQIKSKSMNTILYIWETLGGFVTHVGGQEIRSVSGRPLPKRILKSRLNLFMALKG